MAVNPMQRRTRNSFIIGLLIGLALVAAVGVLAYTKIKMANEEISELKAMTKKVLVASRNIESGEEVFLEDFKLEDVKTSINAEEFISQIDFNESEYVDEDGNPIEVKKIMKISVPEGTIITQNMLQDEENEFSNDMRLQEYNMIILPTTLKNDDFIDIRLRLTTGEDYIVIAKKKVIYCNSDAIWMNMKEDEILTLGNAIVDAYQLSGSKLYATVYTEAGRQQAATPNFPVSEVIKNLIYTDPNTLSVAKNALYNRYNETLEGERRRIDESLSTYVTSRDSMVETGLQEEISKIQEARSNYVAELEGTGMVGINE